MTRQRDDQIDLYAGLLSAMAFYTILGVVAAAVLRFLGVI